jgi:UDP-glucose:(heptosyl)LPS alpha-1,3-glucosyltransferase
MKIAIIRRKYTFHGGAEIFINRLIESLKGSDFDITLISENWNKDKNKTSKKIKTIQIPSFGFFRTVKFLTFQFSIAFLLRKVKFDIIQSHERLLGADIYRLGDGLHLAWLKRYKTICPWYKKLFISIDPYHAFICFLEKRMAKADNLIFVANSQLVKRELISFYNVAEKRIRLIPNGIMLSEFPRVKTKEKWKFKKKIGIDPYSPCIVFIGSGFFRKGAFELVKSIQYLDGYQLILVGHDKEIRKIKKLANLMGLSNRIKFFGPQKNINIFLNAADVYALPSLYDPLPNSGIEALSSGLPLIITADVGLADDVIDFNAGVVVTRDPKSIAKGILEASEKITYMSNNAFKLSKKFDASKISIEWINLYKSIKSSRQAII